MSKKFLFILFICFLPQCIGYAAELVIPATRRITWQGNVGVVGGIPNITSLCETEACNTLYAGTVTAASINSAISSASSGDAVRIPAGVHTVSSTVNLKSGVVLRGAGMTSTVLNVSAGVNSPQTGSLGSAVAISSGYTQGSTAIVVASATGLSAGDWLLLYEGNDTDIVWDRYSVGNLIRQYVKITSVDGTTVNFTPPLMIAFQAELSPNLKEFSSFSTRIGIEDLTLNAEGENVDSPIWYDSCFECWVSDVKVLYGANSGIFLTRTLFNEIRNNYISETTSANDGYGIYANQLTAEYQATNTAILIENNILTDMWTGVLLNNATGCVVAYNYAYDTHTNTGPIYTPSYVTQHGAHGFMTLWEGNIGQQIQNDGYHGSGSHQTIFRNQFHGLSPTGTTGRKMIDLCRFSYYHNIIGNVLGDASWNPTAYEMTGTPESTNSYIYRLGYPHMGNNTYDEEYPPEGTGDPDSSGGLDSKVASTLLRHKNYDYENGAQRVCGSESEGCQSATNVAAEDTIPNSLYLASKPSWFGELTWPPVNPATPSVGNIPAKVYYETGSWFLTHGGGSFSGSATIR